MTAEEYADKVVRHKMAVHDVFDEKKTRAELVEAFNAGLRADAHTDNSEVIANLQAQIADLKQSLDWANEREADDYKEFENLRKENSELKAENAKMVEAKEIIAEFLHLVTYYTTAEDEEKLKEKAKTFLNWPIVEMEVKE